MTKAVANKEGSSRKFAGSRGRRKGMRQVLGLRREGFSLGGKRPEAALLVPDGRRPMRIRLRIDFCLDDPG